MLLRDMMSVPSSVRQRVLTWRTNWRALAAGVACAQETLTLSTSLTSKHTLRVCRAKPYSLHGDAHSLPSLLPQSHVP